MALWSRVKTVAVAWAVAVLPGLLSEFLNDPDEVHALVHGFFVAWTASPVRGREYEKELHYWRAGFLVGYTVKAVVFGVLGYAVGSLVV